MPIDWARFFIEKNVDFLAILLKSRRYIQLSSQPGAHWSRAEVLYYFAHAPDKPVSSLSFKTKQIKATKSPATENSALFKSKLWINSSSSFILSQDSLAFIRKRPFKRWSLLLWERSRSWLWKMPVDCRDGQRGTLRWRSPDQTSLLLLLLRTGVSSVQGTVITQRPEGRVEEREGLLEPSGGLWTGRVWRRVAAPRGVS